MSHIQAEFRDIMVTGMDLGVLGTIGDNRCALFRREDQERSVEGGVTLTFRVVEPEEIAQSTPQNSPISSPLGLWAFAVRRVLLGNTVTVRFQYPTLRLTKLEFKQGLN